MLQAFKSNNNQILYTEARLTVQKGWKMALILEGQINLQKAAQEGPWAPSIPP